jgi:hypothetical protein
MKQITCPFCGDTYPDFDVAHVCSRGPYAPKLKPKMNERIEKLNRLALGEVLNGQDPDNDIDKMYIPAQFTKKFAELIVRECADRLGELGNPELGLGIKKHFGVEE